MSGWWLLWLVAAGCEFRTGAAAGDDGRSALGSDGARPTDTRVLDTSMVVADATACFDVDGVALHVCLAQSPAGASSITTNTAIVTTAQPAPCAPLAVASDPACVLAADTLAIASPATLSASGDLPLVLIASTSIDVDGTIDVASHAGGQVGAMADGAACDAGTAPSDRGGGAGGGYSTKGGDGGDSLDASGDGGKAGATAVLALHGGCAGQSGGETGGAAGDGGGLVILIAPTIALAGTIDASGAGGGGAPTGNTRGGGGGGSGGVIVLQASTIDTQAGAQVYANGGGGGGGTQTSTPGNPGADPSGVAVDPSGGTGGGAAGTGGNGFYSLAAASKGGAGTNGSDGGGGGGGGAGYIHAPAGTTIVGPSVFSPGID